MVQINLKNVFRPRIMIVFIFVLSLAACGGGSGSGSGSSEFGESSTGTAPAADKSITLSWGEPTTNSDGSPLNDLVGYKIYYGDSSSNYTQTIDVGNYTSAVISSLSSGTWCFATTAYDTSGNESDYSNEACTTI